MIPVYVSLIQLKHLTWQTGEHFSRGYSTYSEISKSGCL